VPQVRGYKVTGQRRALGLRMLARSNGSCENLLCHFRRFDDPGRDHRLRKGGQRSVDHRRLNHWCATARSRVSVARTSHGWPGDCAHRLAFARRAVHPQTFKDRKSHARGDNVAPERDRDRRGHRRLGKEVIAWEEFVFGRGDGWCW